VELKLTVTAGPHQGQQFTFDGHDTFLVGREADAHLRLSYDDPYFSRRQFVVEINPPRCRVLDLKSRNGTFVNGSRVATADIKDGDEISAGHTVFKVSVVSTEPATEHTLDLPTRHNLDLTLDLPAAPPTLQYESTDGLRVPGYRVEGELGRGGMGVVYRGARETDGAAVAIKTITPAAGVSGRQVERFVRECSILSDLSHPNIVRFLEVGEANATVFLVMELVEGTDAKKLLADRGPLEPKTAVRLTCQMLKGLAHAHEKGFVHRDLKPGNILIARSADGKKTAKLADFGLARVYESSKLSGLTMQGEVGGTPAFMAPEQVTHYRDVRPAADQYSAAATLYTLLTNRPTHDLPGNVAAQLVHVATEPPVPIADRRPDLPAGLANVIHKALSREPGDRFPDIAAFRAELRKFA
jgi:serine/threonine-protein kinase